MSLKPISESKRKSVKRGEAERKGGMGRARGREPNKKGVKEMLFEPVMLIGGASIVGIALLDKFAEEHGYPWVGTILKLILPIAGYAAGIYFIETNPLLRWIL